MRNARVSQYTATVSETTPAAYECPRVFTIGDFRELTLGNDPCRFNDPRDVYKQTGAADYIQGQANLATCSA